MERDSTKEHTEMWQRILEKADVYKGFQSAIDDGYTSRELETAIRDFLGEVEKKTPKEKVEEEAEVAESQRRAALEKLIKSIQNWQAEEYAKKEYWKLKKDSAPDEGTRKLYEEQERVELETIREEIKRLEVKKKNI